ncbi:MAG: tail fiber domain-containing protein [Saprospiraceae bacterium]|nr:tail fiber domain-containing protein [Saprospiraceae bacterium]
MRTIFVKSTSHYLRKASLFLIFILFGNYIFGQCPQACSGSNTALGEFAGNPMSITGVAVTSIGWTAGGLNTSGNLNTFIGHTAGLRNTTGSNNSYFGAAAGQHLTGNSSSNICIGSLTGPEADTLISNRLFLDNQSGLDPLIYGEFDNDFIRINGTLEVTAGLTNPSSIHLKEQFRALSPEDMLDKVSQLDIQEWSYKKYPNVRHIGPTAEIFHQTFGVGMDDKSISTIDADGVALIAIQALIEKTNDTEQLSEQIEALEKANKELEANLMRIEKKLNGE